MDPDAEPADGHLVAVERVAQPAWVGGLVEAERREDRRSAQTRRQERERRLVWAAARVLSLRRMRTRTSLGSALSRSSPAAAAASSEESLARLVALSPPPPSSIECGDGMGDLGHSHSDASISDFAVHFDMGLQLVCV